MRRWMGVFLLLACVSPVQGKVAVFWQSGFPTVDSQPVEEESLKAALRDMQPVFLGLEELRKPGTLRDADLLVLPYGSALPADAWPAIHEYLQDGGNLLTLGGRPLFVPVLREGDKFTPARPQNTYSRYLGVWHTYEVPQKDWSKFVWDENYSFLNPGELYPRRVFVAGAWWDSGDYRGMGFLVNTRGERVAAPVVSEDFRELRSGEPSALLGTRCVLLNFEPEPGYWASPAGIALVRAAAEYASQGASLLWIELGNATFAEGETPQVVVHLRNVRKQRRGQSLGGVIRVELISGGQIGKSVV